MSRNEPNPWRDYGNQISAILKEFRSSSIPSYEDCCRAYIAIVLVHKEANQLHRDMYHAGKRDVAAVPDFLELVVAKSVDSTSSIMESVHDFHRDKFFLFMLHIVEHPNILGPQRLPGKKIEPNDMVLLSYLSFEANEEMKRIKAEYEKLSAAFERKGLRPLKK